MNLKQTSVLILIAIALSACTQKQQKPNILFIMTDDHAQAAISAYGSVVNLTPQIDRLANEGMLFTRSYVTNSLCAPSRAVILTGKHSHINGVKDNFPNTVFDGTQQTFPKLLQKAGYQTAMIGKWHLKSDPTGFDFWRVLPGQGDYYNPDFLEMDGSRKNYEGYATTITTDFGLDWLESRDKSKPFCLMLQHKAPHRNWMPDLKYLNLFDNVELPIPDNYFDNYDGRGTAAREQKMEVARDMDWAWDLKTLPAGLDTTKGLGHLWMAKYNQLTPEQKIAWNAAYDPKNEKVLAANLKGIELARWKYQRYMKDYLRCIASVDENIGRVLDYLDESGLAENTVVVYTSDQGFYLGEHGWFDKRFMYEESFSTPLIVRWSGVVDPGSKSSELVQNLDFAETFLDIAGVAIPDDMQGKSLLPLLKKQSVEWRNSLYYHYYEYPGSHSVKKHYGVATKRYKLIHFYDDIDEWELYDLEKDPDEMQSVYASPEYAEVQKDLHAELERLRTEYKVE